MHTYTNLTFTVGDVMCITFTSVRHNQQLHKLTSCKTWIFKTEKNKYLIYNLTFFPFKRRILAFIFLEDCVFLFLSRNLWLLIVLRTKINSKYHLKFYIGPKFLQVLDETSVRSRIIPKEQRRTFFLWQWLLFWIWDHNRSNFTLFITGITVFPLFMQLNWNLK